MPQKRPRPPAVSAVTVKRPRGHPRKVRTESETSAAPSASFQSTIDAGPSPAPFQEDDATPAKIDKSKLTFGELRRLRDKAHLEYLALHPCLLCGRNPSDPHHLRFAQPRAMGRKTSDEFVVPPNRCG